MIHLKKLSLILPILIAGFVLADRMSPARSTKESGPRRLEILFFGAPVSNGPAHNPITRYRILKKSLGSEGINLTYSEDPARAFHADTLKKYDAVLMYGNWKQNQPMPKEQLAALLDWVKAGGGFIPVHCASACYGGSPGFIELVGARFKSHGSGEFQVRNVKPNHAILKNLKPYRAWDESYIHEHHGDDREIIQVREDEPWTWTRRHGNGRVFYTAGGHDHRVWDLPEFQQLLRNGILWAVGPHKSHLLSSLKLPVLKQEKVSLPGYRKRREITLAQKPLSPSDSLKLAQVPMDMDLSLFASEPDIVNPIHINWDERGRAYVIETIDYPNNLQQGNIGNDRITICEDTDDDGRADKFTRFTEKLSIPTSLVFANGGVICTNGSEMLFLKDTNADDKADHREVLFKGFRTNDTHAGVSNLRYGLDHWIYATIGYAGFKGKVGGKDHEFSQGVFRFKPDGSQLEFLQNTTNNTWGLGFSGEFDILGSTANGNPSWYATFPRETYRSVNLNQGRTPRADDNPVFNPMSMDIRQVDQFDRYTAGAGHALYTADRFPSHYHNRVAFVCAPTGKLVGHFEMTRDGAAWKAVQSPNNLYASADAWSSPVCAEVGPDGAVWICDWYNIIIQHNPTPNKNSSGVNARNGKGNAYETPFRDKNHGRIYRIFPKDSPNDPEPAISQNKPESLIAALNHPNLFWRLHAQRIIIEDGLTGLEPDLAQLIKTGRIGAPHALHALSKIGRLSPGLIDVSMASPSQATRRAAIRLALPGQLRKRLLRDALSPERKDRESAELLIASSSAPDDAEIGKALYRFAINSPDFFEDPVLNDAWQIAARRQVKGVLAAIPTGDEIGRESVASKNFLPNPGFERVKNGLPIGWSDIRTYNGARGVDVKATASPEGRNGTTCLKVSCQKNTDTGVAIEVQLKPGMRYQLSGWIKTENLQPVKGSPGALLNIHGGERSGRVFDTTDWTRVSLEFTASGSGKHLIHCLFGGYGGAKGTAWFDDLSLIALGDTKTLAGALDSLRAFHDKIKKGEPESIARKYQPDPKVHARGAEVYRRTCIACHGVDGQGVPNVFPSLDGSDWLTGDPGLPIKIVLHGLAGPIKVGTKSFNSVMAPLGPSLSDKEIADVLTYVRQQWSNDASPIDPVNVSKIRQDHKTRTQMWSARDLGR